VDFFRNAHGTNVTWKLQLEKSMFTARFDEAKVQQALTKILENAVEALPKGIGQITVQTHNVELAAPAQDCNVRLAAGIYVCVEIATAAAALNWTFCREFLSRFLRRKKKGIAASALRWFMGSSAIMAAAWRFEPAGPRHVGARLSAGGKAIDQ